MQQHPAARKVALLAAAAGAAALFMKMKEKKGHSAPVARPTTFNRKGEKVAVNMVFFKRLGSLLKVVLPGVFCPETLFMLLVSLSLVSRTTADLWIISTSTSIERAIIGRNKSDFVKYLFHFFCMYFSLYIRSLFQCIFILFFLVIQDHNYRIENTQLFMITRIRYIMYFILSLMFFYSGNASRCIYQ